MPCGDWCIVGRDDLDQVIVHPLSCRSWSCARCAPLLKHRLIRRLSGVKVFSLLTLTCRPALYASPDHAFLSLSLSIPTFFKRLRRAFPDTPIEYFLVWERTKAGWPHAHLLLRAPVIPQAFISDTWRQLTGAPIVDVRKIHQADHAIHYVAKYLAKDPQTPAGMKRYRSSQHFFDAVMSPTDPSPFAPQNWSIRKQSAAEVAAEFSASGYTVRAHPDGSYVCSPRGSPLTPLYDSLALATLAGRSA